MIGSTGGMGAALGRSSLAAIRRTFAGYWRQHRDEAELAQLRVIEHLIRRWPNEHPRSTDAKELAAGSCWTSSRNRWPWSRSPTIGHEGRFGVVRPTATREPHRGPRPTSTGRRSMPVPWGLRRGQGSGQLSGQEPTPEEDDRSERATGCRRRHGIRVQGTDRAVRGGDRCHRGRGDDPLRRDLPDRTGPPTHHHVRPGQKFFLVVPARGRPRTGESSARRRHRTSPRPPGSQGRSSGPPSMTMTALNSSGPRRLSHDSFGLEASRLGLRGPHDEEAP